MKTRLEKWDAMTPEEQKRTIEEFLNPEWLDSKKERAYIEREADSNFEAIWPDWNEVANQF